MLRSGLPTLFSSIQEPASPTTRAMVKPSIRSPSAMDSVKELDRKRGCRRYVALVKFTRQLIAALVVLAWLCAGAHVALEHGGKVFGSHFDAAEHGEHHHGDAPAPGDNEHHHELGVITVAQFAKTSAQQLLAPQWVPIYDRLLAELAALRRGVDVPHEHSVVGDSPPDTRMSGWLFVVQTALQVRGPSLAA